MHEQIANLSIAEQASLTAGRDMWSTAELRDANIGSLKMADGPMGIASGRVDERDISTLTPCSLALGASWDPDLVAKVGSLVGAEANRRGVAIVLGPNLNLVRSPLAGRTFEMFSEDPLLTGLLGTAWIQGLQSQGVGAVAKHLVCNDSETMRNTMNSVVDERALREVYLVPFELAARAGCAGIMAAYNRVNGTYCVEHHELLSRIVKGEWGFGGFTLSDWFGTLHTVESALAGLDLEMPGPGRFFGPPLAAAVGEQKVSVARLSDAAGRVADASTRFSSDRAKIFDAEQTQELLCEAAAAGFVLLKNEAQLLPLLPQRNKRIAVIGPNADAPCYQGGTFAKIAVDSDRLTPMAALRAQYGADADIAFHPGILSQSRLPSLPVTPMRDVGDSKTQGMTVDYFDSHDFAKQPIASETRNTNSLTWFAGLPGNLIVMDQPGGIRVQGVYTPEFSGLHTFLVGGTGSVRLALDGKVVLDHEVNIAPKDIMGTLKGGDAERHERQLLAGRSVTVSIEFRYTPARAHGVWYGVHAPDRADLMLAEAIEAARTADAVLLFVGETADASVESKDRSTTRVPAAQVALIEAVCSANPNTAVIVNAAHAVDLSWHHRPAAILMVWYPGEQFGRALAQVVAGEREPGGRLPVSFAAQEEDYTAFDLTPDDAGDLRYSESWRIGYRSMASEGRKALFSLGAGVGYTSFIFSNAVYQPEADAVRVRVANVGDRVGKQVVQVYAYDSADAPCTPLLAGFQSVTVDPGSSTEVSVALRSEVFRQWAEETRCWVPSQTRSILRVGTSLATADLEIAGRATSV